MSAAMRSYMRNAPKAAIYTRLSKEDDDLERDGYARESESIQNQKSMLIEYAVEHGYDIYRIFSDEDYSGMDRNRPAFNEMLRAASEHRFDIILAKTQSRFTRDMELVEKYLHGKFIEWGIRFIAVVDRVDTADAANKKSRQINGLINEWYLEDLSDNIRSVLTHKRKEGRYIATFPLYGYLKDPEDNGHLVIDPVASEVVRKIYAWYLAGKGVTWITRTLNEQGIPSPTRYKELQGFRYKKADSFANGDIWGKPTVYQILKNQTYIGNLEQGRNLKISYKSDRIVRQPKEKWIIVPDTHEAIIDKESFERVQQMMKTRVRGGGNGAIHPLAGKVICGICGSTMEQTGSGYCSNIRGVRYKYFRCRMQLRDPSRCSGQLYVHKDRLEKLVLERIRGHVATHLAPESFDRSMLAEQARQKNALKRQELEKLQGEIARRRKAMQELYLDKSSGLIDTVQFRTLNQNFLDEVDSLQKRCEQLADQMEDSSAASEKCKQVESYLHEIAEVRQLSRELVSLLIEKVVIYPPDTLANTRKIEIVWNF